MMHLLNPTGMYLPSVRRRRLEFVLRTVILHAPDLVRKPAEIHQHLSEGVGGGSFGRHPPQSSQLNAFASLCWFPH